MNFVVSHELLHSPAKGDKRMATLALMPAAYSHWVASHLAHHRKVQHPSCHICQGSSLSYFLYICRWCPRTNRRADYYLILQEFILQHGWQFPACKCKIIVLLANRTSSSASLQVGKMDDPTTARLGEPLYKFIPRSVWGNIVDGWCAEQQRLRFRQLPFFSPQNRFAPTSIWRDSHSCAGRIIS